MRRPRLVPILAGAPSNARGVRWKIIRQNFMISWWNKAFGARGLVRIAPNAGIAINAYRCASA